MTTMTPTAEQHAPRFVDLHRAPSTNAMPARLVGISTKMYFGHAQAVSYASSLTNLFPSPLESLALFFVPSFTEIAASAKALSPYILLGAQDCHWEDVGAWTGEVSPAVLAQLGCSIVELGHAERKKPPIGETDQLVAQKAAAVVRNGMIPLVCIGEGTTSASGIASEGVGLALAEVLPQVDRILAAVPDGANLVLTYEPVWAIGAAEPAPADHICAVVGQIKDRIAEAGRRDRVRVLYGGSAGPGTWGVLAPACDGLFLGRFAHNVANLRKVVEEMQPGLA